MKRAYLTVTMVVRVFHEDDDALRRAVEAVSREFKGQGRWTSDGYEWHVLRSQNAIVEVSR